jgi:putative DNA primase/helicase
MHWDGIRWSQDDRKMAEKLALKTVWSILPEAFAASKEREKKELTGFAYASQNGLRIQAMLKIAESVFQVVRPEELDTDIWLLNTTNGVLDLRTGGLSPHNSTRLITKAVRCRYDPTATCPLWTDFLNKVMAGNSGSRATSPRLSSATGCRTPHKQTTFLLHEAESAKVQIDLLEYVFHAGQAALPAPAVTQERSWFQVLADPIAKLIR